MDTYFVVADGEKTLLSAQQLPCLLNCHSHCSIPTPTRYLETPIVSIWPLAMVGTFPNQTDQYFKNFPKEIKRRSLLWGAGGRVPDGARQKIKSLALKSYIFHHVKKVKIFCERMKLTYQHTHTHTASVSRLWFLLCIKLYSLNALPIVELFNPFWDFMCQWIPLFGLS